jgi:hypothetical protein
VIDLLNKLIGTLADSANAAMQLLPTSPLAVGTRPADGGLMGFAAYFLPLHEIGLVMDALLVATLAWYGVRIVLHWFKVTAG